jgi:hypothetical protein
MFKSNNATYNALLPFTQWGGNLNVVIKPIQIGDLGFVPYLTDQTWLEATANLSAPIIFTHNTFLGADFGFKLATEGIAVSEVATPFVVSGHIHKRQELIGPNTKIIYPGTPYSWSASDVDEVKGLMMLETCDGNLTTSFVDSPFPTWRKITVDPTTTDHNTFKTKHTGDHLLIKVVGLRADVKAWLSSDHLAELKANNASVSVSTEFTDSAKRSASIASVQKDSDPMESYMSSIYKGAAPKSLVIKAIQEAMESVR